MKKTKSMDWRLHREPTDRHSFQRRRGRITLLPVIRGFVCIVLPAGCQGTTQQTQLEDELDLPIHSALLDGHHTNKPKEPQFIRGNHPILGRAVAVACEQVKIDIGEVHPRLGPLKSAMEKSFSVQLGDDLILVPNEHSFVVDYHLLDEPIVEHRIVRGTIARLPIGHHRSSLSHDSNKRRPGG